MQAVGIRELKARLSHFVSVAKTGEIVLVTEHGKVVATLGPPSTSRLPPELAGYQTLVDRGIATPAGPNRPEVYVSTGLRSPPGTAQALIDEMREDN